MTGLHFECAQCGNCCSGPGEGCIWVTKKEIKLIADFLKITESQFRDEYIKRIGWRTTIVEQPATKDCIFLRKTDGQKKCVIYPVRPNQCITWPFWTTNLTNPKAWNKANQKCPGINRGKLYSFEQVEKIRKKK